MSKLQQLILSALIAAMMFASPVLGAVQNASAHNYYGGTYCSRGTLWRVHVHGVYEIGGGEVAHHRHDHAVGLCY